MNSSILTRIIQIYIHLKLFSKSKNGDMVRFQVIFTILYKVYGFFTYHNILCFLPFIFDMFVLYCIHRTKSNRGNEGQNYEQRNRIFKKQLHAMQNDKEILKRT